MKLEKYLANKSSRLSFLRKNILLFLVIIFVFTFGRLEIAAAKTKASPASKKSSAAVKMVKKKPVKSNQTKTTLKWTASGLKALGSMASFDYSYTIRNAVIKKVEKYARRKNIKTITAAVINSMDE